MRQLVISFVVLIVLASGLVAQVHFDPVAGNGDPWSIIVNNATIDGLPLEPGDEIGAYDADLCVGASVFEQTPASVTVWQRDLGNNLPGYIAYNPILMRIWDSSEDVEYEANITFINGVSTYRGGGYSLVVISAGIEPPDQPDIMISPLFWNWGNVYVGNEVPHDFEVQNIGELDLVFTATVDLPGFSPVLMQDVVVAPGESETITVTFAPEDDVLYSGNLVIVSNDPDSPEMNVEIQGTGEFEFQGPDIYVEPLQVNFGDLIVNTDQTENITVRNDGDTDLIFSASLDVPGFELINIVDMTVTPGNSETIPVIFNPTSAMYYSGTVGITSNDADTPLINIPVDGTGVLEPEPEIVINPENHDFGDVALNTPVSYDFTITNNGNADLEIFQIMQNPGNPEFTFEPLVNNMITPGNSETLTINFNPTNVGEETETFTVISNAPNMGDYAIIVTGAGVEEVVTHFVPVPRNGDPWSIIVSEATINGVSLDLGDEIGVFDLQEENLLCVGASVFEELPQNISVWKRDLGNGLPGFIEGNPIIIYMYDASEDMEYLAQVEYLQGNGLFGFAGFAHVNLTYGEVEPEPNIVVDNTNLNYGQITVNTEETTNVTVSNNGDADLVFSASLDADGFGLINVVDVTVNPGNDELIPVVFMPTEAVFYDGAMVITSNDPDTPTINVFVEGTGQALPEPNISVDPASLNFFEVVLEEEVTENVTVYNNGDADLVFSASLNADGFTEINLVDILVTSGNNTVIPVGFMPTEAIAYDGVLFITSNDPDTPEVQVPVEGVGEEAGTPDHFSAFITGDPWSVIVTEALLNNESIEAGDEIGVFDGELCVGYDVYQGIALNISAWEADLGNGLPGYTEGNPISYKIWDSSSETEYDAYAEYTDGNGLFGIGPFARITLWAGDPPPIPEISVDPVAYDFGDLEFGQFDSFDLTISNNGEEDLVVSSVLIDGNAAFSVDGFNGTIAPMGSEVLQVTFEPTEAMEYVASVVVNSNDPVNPVVNVPLAGQGIYPTHFDVVAPTGVYYGVLIQSAEIDMQPLEMGDEIALFDGEFCVGAVTYIGQEFPLAIDCIQADPAQLLPGFTPGNPIQVKAWNNSENMEVEAVYDLVEGDGTYGFLPFTVIQVHAGMLPPDIELSTATIEFGDVHINNDLSIDMTVYNHGEGDLHFSAMIDGEGFAVAENEQIVGPGSEIILPVTFMPEMVQLYQADLHILSNSPGEEDLVVRLTGNGYRNPAPEIHLSTNSIDFGELAVGGMGEENFAIFNMGDANLDVEFSFTGEGAEDFGITGDLTILPESNFVYTVTFTPTMGIVYDVDLNISSNDEDEPILVVNLAGSAVYEQHFYPVPRTGNPWAIRVSEGFANGELLQEGDEIAAFDGEICVGATILNGEWPSSIVCWEADPGNDLLGYTEGNPIMFEIWDQSQGTQLTGYAEFIEYGPNFGIGPFANVTLTDNGTPIIEVSTDLIEFSLRRINTNINMPFTITNNGNLALVFGEPVFEGEGFVAPELNGVSIAPGESENFHVGFMPTVLGEYTGTLTIVSNDPENPEVLIGLHGEGASQVVDIVEAYDFGEVMVSSSGTYDLEINNIGNWDLTVTSVNVSGEGFRGGTIRDMVIDPGEFETLQITFEPNAPVAFEGMITVHSDDPVNPEVTVNLTGAGIAPDIELSTDLHDFGGLHIGESNSFDLQISNMGNMDLEIYSAMVDVEGFYVNEYTTVIPPEGNDVLTVFFNPMVGGDFEGLLEISSNDPSENLAYVTLLGHGLAQDIAVSDVELDFGGLPLFTENTIDLTISNVGTWGLGIVSATVTGDGFSSEDITDIVIDPEGEIVVPITFMPEMLMDYEGWLTIISDDPDESELVVNLYGYGMAPELSLGSDMIEFGEVELLSTSPYDFVITNTGNMDLTVDIMLSGNDVFTGEIVESLVIEPQMPYTYTINFMPVDDMVYEATLTIISNDPFNSDVEVPVSGIGYYDYYFTPVENTGLPYSIIVNNAMLDGVELNVFDEIAVFDGDLCVGVELVTGEFPMGVTAWQADLANGLPGFVRGHEMEFRIFSMEDNEAYSSDEIYEMGNGTFGFMPFTALTLSGSRLQYFAPVLPTGNPYAIIVEEADIDNNLLTFGDEIGIYDGNLCVGAARVSENWPLPINTWQADPAHGLEGFTPGDPISFKFWTEDDDRLHSVIATINEGDGYFGTLPLTAVSLSAMLNVTIEQSLRSNYFEMVSLNLIPEDLSAPNIFSSLASLRIVMNDYGRMYVPQYNVNTIGNVEIPEAYRVFVSEPETWSVQGLPLDPAEVTYSLTADRWNYMGYPYTVNIDVEEALAAIADITYIVQSDDAGMWVPMYNVNTMGDMRPGQGYMIIVREDVDFVYGDAVILANAPKNSNLTIIPEAEGAPQATGMPYHLLVSFTDELKAQNPATIEVYDGLMLVGKNVVQDGMDLHPVVAWGGSEEYKISGYTEGNEIHCVVRDAEGNKIATVAEGSEKAHFGEGGFGMITLSEAPLPTSFEVSSAYPNPFNPTVTVPFAIPNQGNVSFTIFNVLGQQVYNANQIYPAGHHRFMFDAGRSGESLTSGVYFLQVQHNDQVKMQKLLLLK